MKKNKFKNIDSKVEEIKLFLNLCCSSPVDMKKLTIYEEIISIIYIFQFFYIFSWRRKKKCFLNQKQENWFSRNDKKQLKDQKTCKTQKT